MAQKIEAYKADDGKLFETEAEATQYEEIDKRLALIKRKLDHLMHPPHDYTRDDMSRIILGEKEDWIRILDGKL